uniref:Uncharacterized protein n=1 Tax=Glossina austeni TaxID=7395 RepID=A0A1A9UEA5_GLOAU
MFLAPRHHPIDDNIYSYHTYIIIFYDEHFTSSEHLRPCAHSEVIHSKFTPTVFFKQLGAINTINKIKNFEVRKTTLCLDHNKTAGLMLFTSVHYRLSKAYFLFRSETKETQSFDFDKSLNQLSNSHLTQNYFEVISIGDYRDKYQFASANKSRMRYKVSSNGLVD